MRLEDLQAIRAQQPQDLAPALRFARKEDNAAYIASRSLIAESGASYDSMHKIDPAYEGRFTLCQNGIRFECYVKPRTAASRLYVMFSGARGSKEPTFKRWSYWRIIDGHVLSIDDPMVHKQSELTFGWYYGTENQSYLEEIRDIVLTYAALQDVEDIVFFSSSAGGYAALFLACLVEGSTAIAINPQIRLSLYSGATKFQNITGIDLSQSDPYGRNELPELIARCSKSRFVLVQNVEAIPDMTQLAELENALGYSGESRLGIRRIAPNVLSWIYQAARLPNDNPHELQDWATMFSAIDLLAQEFDRAELLEDVYLVFSELWHDHFLMQKEKLLLRDKLSQIKRAVNVK